jgi:hypothetical protein
MCGHDLHDLSDSAGDPATTDTQPTETDATDSHPSGPQPSAFLRNLRQPMPLGRKIRLVVRNNAIKFKTASTCCGHPGEPGC